MNLNGVENIIEMSLAQRIGCTEELFKKPSLWVPKLNIQQLKYDLKFCGNR